MNSESSGELGRDAEAPGARADGDGHAPATGHAGAAGGETGAGGHAGECDHPDYSLLNLFNTKGVFGEEGFHATYESVLPPFWRCDPAVGGAPAGEVRMTMALNTILVVALVGGLCVRAGRGIKHIPGRLQAGAEIWLEGLIELLTGFGGEYVARKYIGLLGGFFTLILSLNLWGLIPGFHSPTADYNTTFAFASIAIVASLLIGLRESGLRRIAYHWCGEPKDMMSWVIGVLLLFPLEFIAQLSRTLSLSFRLFGNIFGGDMVVAVFVVLSADVAAKVAIGNITLLPLPLHLPVILLHLIASVV
ncbi:F0F1 ATP synthase subunit A, partial [bacterium]|nr:F0F1 ATP synthase subunit A [bacterium]